MKYIYIIIALFVIALIKCVFHYIPLHNGHSQLQNKQYQLLQLAQQYKNFEITQDAIYAHTEALRLYKTIHEQGAYDHNVRARALIEYMRLYAQLDYNTATAFDNLQRVEFVVDDKNMHARYHTAKTQLMALLSDKRQLKPDVLVDLRATLADLYYAHDFDLSAQEQTQFILDQLQNAIHESQDILQPYVKASMRLVKFYLEKKLDVTESVAKARGLTLLNKLRTNAVLPDKDDKKSHILIAELTADPSDHGHHDILNAYLYQPKIRWYSILKKPDKAESLFQEKLADKYFVNFFNMDKTESIQKGLHILEKLAHKWELSDKERLGYKKKLIAALLNPDYQVSRQESLKEAYIIAQALETECVMVHEKHAKRTDRILDKDAIIFAHLCELAIQYARNVFDLEKEKSYAKACELFTMLLKDKHLHPSNRAYVREQLADIYLDAGSGFKPSDMRQKHAAESGEKNVGKNAEKSSRVHDKNPDKEPNKLGDVKSAVLGLYHQITDDHEQSFEKWLSIKLKLIALYRMQWQMLGMSLRDANASLQHALQELQDNNTLNVAQKKWIRAWVSRDGNAAKDATKMPAHP